MGIVIISSILITNNIARQYAEVEVVALIVIALTAFLFVVSYIIVGAFEKIVVARKVEAEQSRRIIELKDQFVFIPAHELKTPARAIEDSMIELEAANDPFFEKQEHLVAKIKKSNKRLLALVQDLLQVARIEGHTIHLALHKVSVTGAYHDAIEELQKLKEKRNIKLTENIPEGLLFIQANEMRFKEVLINFLSNAIKYSDPEHGEVTFGIEEKDDEVIVSVANNGPQIKPEDQVHVFQKFWRSKSAQESKQEGTGLGLFIVKQLVELMDGRAWFTSDPKKTTFYASFQKSKKSV